MNEQHNVFDPSATTAEQLAGLHAEIGGGYAQGPKIVSDAAEIFPGQIEVMTLNTVTGDEIESVNAADAEEARRIFSEMVQRHAEPLQQDFLRADMSPGERYTIFHLGEWGFPIAQKITFHKMELTTYAQHRDVIKLTFTPARKRSMYEQRFYNTSFIICAGWQDIDETKTKIVLTDTPELKTTKTKYACFDSRYIDDAESYLQNIIVIHKAYRTGTNGKIYA